MVRKASDDRCLTQGVLHDRDLAIEGGLTPVVDRRRRHPVLHVLARLLGALGHVLRRSGLLEQRAVLEHGEVEVAELDPVGARQQQLAVARRDARRARSHRGVTARYSIQCPPLVSSPSLMKSRPAVTLRRAHLGHGVAQTLLVDVDSTPHVVRRRQRADVRRQDSFRAPPHWRHPQASRGRLTTRRGETYPARYLRSDVSAAGEGGAAGRRARRRGVQLRPRCGDDGHARRPAGRCHGRRVAHDHAGPASADDDRSPPSPATSAVPSTTAAPTTVPSPRPRPPASAGADLDDDRPGRRRRGVRGVRHARGRGPRRQAAPMRSSRSAA